MQCWPFDVSVLNFAERSLGFIKINCENIFFYITIKIGSIILNNGFKIHPLFQSFESLIREHLLLEKDNILKKLDILTKKNPKPAKISLNIYNILMPINYPALKAELTYRLNNL